MLPETLTLIRSVRVPPLRVPPEPRTVGRPLVGLEPRLGPRVEGPAAVLRVPGVVVGTDTRVEGVPGTNDVFRAVYQTA